MKPVSPTSGKIANMVKIVVSFIYVMVPLAVLIYRFYIGAQVDTVIMIMVLTFIIASGYVLFGEKVMDKATDEAQEINSGEGDNEN